MTFAIDLVGSDVCTQNSCSMDIPDLNCRPLCTKLWWSSWVRHRVHFLTRKSTDNAPWQPATEVLQRRAIPLLYPQYTRWGKSKFPVVSTQNIVFILVRLFINYSIFHRNHCKSTFAPRSISMVILDRWLKLRQVKVSKGEKDPFQRVGVRLLCSATDTPTADDEEHGREKTRSGLKSEVTLWCPSPCK